MSTFRSFEEIEAWQRARELARRIRAICKRDNVRRDFAWIDQITRSSRSIAANIAEGYEMLTTPQFIAHLGSAKGSCGEVRSHLYDGADEEYISDQEFKELIQETKEISKMISGLIQYLQKAKKAKTAA